MFKTIKLLFNKKNKDIRKKVLFTLGCLFVFIIGKTIPVPGTQGAISSLGLWELYNAISGGGLEQFSIFALGVMPYISASLITGILQMDIIPYFTELKEQGATGQQKINQINRYLGLAIAFLQGFGMAFAFLPNGNAIDYLKVAIILTGGTAFLLWMADQMTQKGIGSGVSLLIMAGIVSSIPNMFIETFQALVLGNESLFMGIVAFSIFILVYIAIIVGIIFIEKSERRIPIQYANQTSSAYGARQNYIPFKLNSASVMPVIFASVVFTIPTFVASLLDSENAFAVFVTKYVNYTTPVGFAAYMIIIILFCFFYTFLQINPEELSKNLNKQGGYIPGVRPGKETKQYISTVIGRITLIGALFIAVVAGLPIVFSSFINTGLPASVSLGGTSILIAIGVTLETYNQLESSLLNRSYKGGR
ncbi:MAG: preprotein translocase subunit SecY [Bacilli bacterium]|nr:preprotein translocase subunit SecY [Bacilli bacterium]